MIQFLRGTQSQLQSNQQIFAAGQPIFESDTGQLKIGNGINNFAGLPYVGGSAGSGWTKIQAEGTPTSGWVSSIYIDLDENTRLTIGQGLFDNASNAVLGNHIVTFDDSNDNYQWAVMLSASKCVHWGDPSIFSNCLYYGASAHLQSSTMAAWVSGLYYWSVTKNIQVQLSILGNDQSDFNNIPTISISYWIVSSNS